MEDLIYLVYCFIVLNPGRYNDREGEKDHLSCMRSSSSTAATAAEKQSQSPYE